MPSYAKGDVVRLKFDVVKLARETAAGLRVTLPKGALFVVVGPGPPWGDVSAGISCSECNAHGAIPPDARSWDLLACHLELVTPAAVVAEPDETKGGGLFD